MPIPSSDGVPAVLSAITEDYWQRCEFCDGQQQTNEKEMETETPHGGSARSCHSMSL